MAFTNKLSLPATAIVLMLFSTGCSHDDREVSYVGPPAPNGTISDDIWKKQEENAEAADFVVHEHEFVGNTTRLNRAGEDHVKQIAARVPEVPFPVLVQPSSMTRRSDTKFGYPIHGNDTLDLKRRELIVRALTSMGVDDAESRVVVAPAFATGFEQFEAERAYQGAFNGSRAADTSYGFHGGFGGFFGF